MIFLSFISKKLLIEYIRYFNFYFLFIGGMVFCCFEFFRGKVICGVFVLLCRVFIGLYLGLGFE